MTSLTNDPLTIVTTKLEERIGPSRYNLWFKEQATFSAEEGMLVIGVPNSHYEEWLRKTFGNEIQAVVEEILAPGASYQFRVRTQPVEPVVEKEVIEPTPPAEPPKPKQRKEQKQEEEPKRARSLERVRRWKKLSAFVSGPCNRVAYASAQSVVEDPGEGVNPLVLHGPVGTGKTHLLEGIYIGLRQAYRDWRITFITSEEFTNRFVQAMRFEKLSSFRRAFRDCDALLVDDLQFLARKKATQEEFLHTFDTLLAEGRQIVVTCDCHPRLTEEFTPELTDRLLGGAVWGLAPPDKETRLEILRYKAGQGSMNVRDEALHFLAEQLRGNVRELEGALNSVRHYSKVVRRKIDIPLVREALADLLRHAIRVVQLPDLDKEVCATLELSSGTLQSKNRAWAVSHPRMIAMYLARKHTTSSYSDIGKYFGGRNHSTVVAAEKRVRKWIEEDADLVLGKQRRRVTEVIERVERTLLD